VALRFVDGFDHYTTPTQALRKWTANYTSYPGTFGGTSTGRFSGGSYHINNCYSGNPLIKTLDAQPTWILGTAHKFNMITTGVQVFAVLDGNTLQMDVRQNADGTMSVTRNGTVLGTTPSAVGLANQWNYYEFKTTIHPTAGAYELRVNGQSLLSATNVNTRNTANSSANQIQCASWATSYNGGSGVYDFDDFYACDGTGTNNNDFLGEMRIETLYPNSPGTNTNFTPNPAGANYANVKETPPDDDASVVMGGTFGLMDTYLMSHLSGTPTSIKGTMLTIMARKDNAGTRAVSPVIRSGGNNNTGATMYLGASYVCYMRIDETDPGTGAAWTAAGVNAVECGQSVTI